MRLAQRTFSLSDQERFAAVSGDHNPMHVDARQARRTQAGAPVVHGIHLLLWALDAFAAAQPILAPLRSLRAQFNKFVYLDEYVEVALTQKSGTAARLVISANNAPRSKVTIEIGDAEQGCAPWSASSLESISFSPEPLNLNFEQMSDLSGQLSFRMTPDHAVALFPAATKWLGARRIAALAASTHLVGMVCPGLHSIYSEVSLTVCAESDPEGVLGFRVTEADARVRSIEQEITGGGLTGT